MKYIKKFENYEDKSEITDLNLENRKLTELPDLSEYVNLKRLFCYNNNLTSLPELPKSLKHLACGNNKLTSLPELPNLTGLHCNGNQLTSLPKLPDSLVELFCQNNKLKSLPNMPERLRILDCSGNDLPFDDIYEFDEWYKEKSKLIGSENLEDFFDITSSIDKYNL